MTIAKFRAAILVFLVGFSLGLSVFVASRLFVRAILSNDAIAAAEHLAAQLADGKPGTSGGALSSVVRYTLLRPQRKSRRQRVAGRRGRQPAADERKRSRRALRGRRSRRRRRRRNFAPLEPARPFGICDQAGGGSGDGRRSKDRHPYRRGRSDRRARIAQPRLQPRGDGDGWPGCARSDCGRFRGDARAWLRPSAERSSIRPRCRATR